MAEFDAPDRVVAAMVAFLDAGAEVARLAAAHPPPTEIAAGKATLTEDQRAQWRAAFAEERRLGEALRNDPWWAEVPPGQRLAAEAHVRGLAKTARSQRDAQAPEPQGR
ncbi:hypothetical protein C1I98_24010 [Spongiactinospora gelatinilytica]|uniref:Uncharacterized protein n=1 Tax=Spongiactinospora gelatinilytica TaxID=2666298 RepID=A0A2W2FNB3_9ACTN|nr:hypothetical protein [Spongiactinospora gelatinilytica]PZG38876.1 hypothetical protein C1I98_24010 [Spongiactinospora gelatinilytica]